MENIINCRNFDVNNVIFEKPRHTKTDRVQYSRIHLKYKYPDGTIDRMHIQTPELFSWGVQENNENYTFPLVMYDQTKGPSQEEAKTIAIFEQTLEAIKEHLKAQETKDELQQFELDPLIEGMDIFYRKRDKGQIIQGYPPTMYPKLQASNRKITTDFRGLDDEAIDSSDLVNVRCRAVGNVLIHNIFITSKKRPVIQLKLDEAIISKNLNRRRLLIDRC